MRFTSTIFIALRALRRNKLRSFLTALGIIIGVGAVIAMVSFTGGAKAQIEAQVASLGQNVIVVYPGTANTGGMRGGWGSMSTLTAEEAEAIAQEVAHVGGVSAEVRDRNQVLANGLNWNTLVLGESPDFPFIRSWPIVSGAMFSETDVKNVAKVAIIGKTVADQLFPNEDPIGQTLRIRNIPFKIVGLLAAKGFNLAGVDQDDVVIVPYTSHMRRVSRRTNISSILIQAESPEHIEKVQEDVTDLLTQRRRGREADFTVRSQVEIAEAATANSRVMTIILGAIASVSLVVGGIGVMNIMLVSVTERTREIGIRIAVGAHGKDVLRQFLIEAVILSALSGIVGILVGVTVSRMLASGFGWPVLISTFWVVTAFAVSVIIGVLAGFYPAYKASQLDPIDALRYE